MLSTIVSANNWEKINLGKDPFTGKEAVGFVNASKDKGKYGKNIELIVRCGQKSYPEILVNWNTFLDLEKVKMLERLVSFDKEYEEELTKIKASFQEELQKLGKDILDTNGKYYKVSKDSLAMFYPDMTVDEVENNELELKRKLYDLANSKTLVLRIAPYQDNPRTATFELSGLNELILPYKDMCKLTTQSEALMISKKLEENARKRYENALKKYQSLKQPNSY